MARNPLSPLDPNADPNAPEPFPGALGTGSFVTKAPLNTASGAVAPPFGGPEPAPAPTPKQAAPAMPAAPAATGAPKLVTNDQASVDAYLAYMASQPGVNPSVGTDKAYWRSKILSGELGNDEAYIRQKMMTPEGAPAGAVGAPISAPAAVAPAPPTDMQNAYHDVIMGLLRGPTPEQAGRDVGNTAQAGAYRNATMRNLSQARAGAVEQAGVQGTETSGGLNTRVNALNQQAGQNIAGYEGQLAEAAVTNRRLELMQALQMAMQTGQFDLAQELQRELAASQTAYNYAGLNQQGDIANKQMGFNYAQLNQQGDQSYNDAILRLLAGGA